MNRPFGTRPDQPVYVISVAAELAGMHAQTLRQYDRLGLVVPVRTRGGGRRYSARDVDRLRQVQQLSAEGVGLAGIQRVLKLQAQVEQMQERVADLTEQVDRLRGQSGRIFAAGPDGQIVSLRPGQRPRRSTGSAVVLWSEQARRR